MLAAKQAGLSGQDIGDRLGIGRSAVSFITSKNGTDSKHWPAIAAMLNVPLAWLVYGHGDPPDWWAAAIGNPGAKIEDETPPGVAEVLAEIRKLRQELAELRDMIPLEERRTPHRVGALIKKKDGTSRHELQHQ